MILCSSKYSCKYKKKGVKGKYYCENIFGICEEFKIVEREVKNGRYEKPWHIKVLKEYGLILSKNLKEIGLFLKSKKTVRLIEVLQKMSTYVFSVKFLDYIYEKFSKIIDLGIEVPLMKIDLSWVTNYYDPKVMRILVMSKSLKENSDLKEKIIDKILEDEIQNAVKWYCYWLPKQGMTDKQEMVLKFYLESLGENENK